LSLLISYYCFFKGINELAEGLGFVSFVSRQKKKAAADEAKRTTEKILRRRSG
jgi:hypothetical protein